MDPESYEEMNKGLLKNALFISSQITCLQNIF